MNFDLVIDPPWMNAAGSLGFKPDPHGVVDLSKLGAFVSNPISPGRRSPTQGIRMLTFTGGYLLHTGFPNPGMKTALKRFAGYWRRSVKPMIVHLLCQSPNEVGGMVAQLEAAGGIAGIEIGLPPNVEVDTAIQMARKAIGELPVILRLPLERAEELAGGIAHWMELGLEHDRDFNSPARVAFSLGPPRGALPDMAGGIMRGRIYGPAVFPFALATLLALRPLGVALIGAGGVYQEWQAQAMLEAGALAVQVDGLLWRGGWLTHSAGG